MGGLTKDLWFIFAHILILQNCIHKNLELLVSTTGQFVCVLYIINCIFFRFLILAFFEIKRQLSACW